MHSSPSSVPTCLLSTPGGEYMGELVLSPGDKDLEMELFLDTALNLGISCQCTFLPYLVTPDVTDLPFEVLCDVFVCVFNRLMNGTRGFQRFYFLFLKIL